jgi:muscarinic acetylcholine receptor M3
MITSPATTTSTDDVFSVVYANVTQVTSFNDSNSTYAGGANDTGGVASYAGGVPMWQMVLFGTLTAVTSVTTVLGNLVVILSFVIERTLRQPTNFFILSLAVSDLLIGLLSMPLYSIYLLAGKWMLGAFVCDLWLSIDYTVCLASIYTVSIC